MKVALINPPGGYYAERWRKGLLPPLGLGYLAGYMELHGLECEVIDARIMGWRLQDLYHHLKDSKPDVIGVTIVTENRFEGFDTIRMARKALPESLIIAGGPHASAAADDTLRHIPELDAVVRGEGEETLLDIVRAFESGSGFQSILGASCRVDGEVTHGEPRPMIHDLDSLPLPARHLMSMDRYQFSADIPGMGKVPAQNIMTSRGCPFSCNFCATPNTWGRRYRYRGPESVLSEIDELVGKYKARAIWFFDDTFTVNRARTAAICEGLAQRHPGTRYYCEIRVDTVDLELLRTMRDTGCFCVAFGVESGSQRIIDQSIGKGIRLEQAAQVIEWCRDLGIQYNPFMILSHPDETMEDADKSRKLIREWKGDGAPVSMAIMHVYPGTRIETIAREKGIIPGDFSWARREDTRRVTMLPAAQGQVPVFLDRLPWAYISDSLFEWADMQEYSVCRKIPRAVASIRSFDDAKRYWAMFRAYIARKDRSHARTAHSIR